MLTVPPTPNLHTSVTLKMLTEKTLQGMFCMDALSGLFEHSHSIVIVNNFWGLCVTLCDAHSDHMWVMENAKRHFSPGEAQTKCSFKQSHQSVRQNRWRACFLNNESRTTILQICPLASAHWNPKWLKCEWAVLACMFNMPKHGRMHCVDLDFLHWF